MFRKIRLRIALSIKPIEKPDDWHWNRWLKTPLSFTDSFSFKAVKIQKREKLNSWFQLPSLNEFNFIILPVEISDEDEFSGVSLTAKSTKSKRFLLITQKSYRIFFNLVASTVISNLITKEKETVIKSFLTDEDKKRVQNKITNLNSYLFPYTAIINYESHFQNTPEITDIFTQSENPEVMVSSDKLTSFVNIKVFNQFPERDEHTDIIDFESLLKNEILIIDKLPKENIPTTNEYFFSLVNLIPSSPLLTKEKGLSSKVTENLLQQSSKVKIINKKNKFLFKKNEFSRNLLQVSSPTEDISLLSPEKFNDAPVSKIDFQFAENNISVFQNSFFTIFAENNHAITEIFISEKPVKKLDFLIEDEPSNSDLTKSLELKNFDSAVVFYPEINPNKMPIHFFKDDFNKTNISFLQKDEAELIQNPILSPPDKYEINLEETGFDGLHQFQRQGIEFLINNKLAFISDEQGVGKKLQIVNALKLLFRKGRIRNVLILSDETFSGEKEFFRLNKKTEEWEEYCYVWSPELKFKNIHKDHSNKYANIKYDIYDDYNLFSRIHKFDCIILYNYSSKYEYLIQSIKEFKPKYLWINPINHNVDITIFIQFYKYFNIKDKTKPISLERKKKEVSDFLPERIYRNKWLELDEKQKIEYDYTFLRGQIKIYSAIEKGNLFIIRPQLFTLLHELMQICNFPSEDNVSRKSELLLNQLNEINGKVVVFSQYEKHGIEKLEKLFTENSLKYLTFKSGTESEKIANEFRAKKEIKVLLTDVKAFHQKINVGEISSIIHFDHWWNSASLWHLEDGVAARSHNKLNIYTYWTKNTIEEKIFRILAEKGLTDKSMIDSYSSAGLSEMISNEEWLDIFEIKSTENILSNKEMLSKIEMKLRKLTTEELSDTIQKLFFKNGYTQDIVIQNLDEILRPGFIKSRVRNGKVENILIKICNQQTLKPEDIEVFYNNSQKIKNISRVFLITSGTFDESSQKYFNYFPDKLVFIDGTKLASYILLFNIL